MCVCARECKKLAKGALVKRPSQSFCFLMFACLLPTCQVRVVRFYVSHRLLLLLVLLPSSSRLNRKQPRPVFSAGPEPRTEGSHLQCSLPEDMSERMSEDITETVSEMSEDTSEKRPEQMSERMSEDTSERRPEDMSERM